ncbi:hypothetical protein [Bacillus seohaeanensis]|jgi:ribonuclease HI|uniref:Uncharacterized protein n=1 Tax=Bacillus seohaeanensis TaxID=284580 RepID=A0ABW5RMZ0_9BACI
MDVKALSKKANKYKKWLENSVLINPFSYEVNGVDYYIVIYKRNSNVKGYSVISEGFYSSKDAIKAFETLVLYTVFANNFFEGEETKMKLSPDYFFEIADKINHFLQSSTEKNKFLLKGKNTLIELGDILKDLQKYIRDYSNHYDEHILKTNRIDEREYESILETLSHLNRLQYLQGKVFLDSFEDLKGMEREMKKQKIDQQLSRDQQIVLKELLNGTKETKQSIKALDIEKKIAHLPVEEQIKILVEEFKKAGRNNLDRHKRNLRYPKL